MFIDFEGIDGSGKTTLSNKLATRLARLGYRVAHAREGGELQSPTARRIRELTRDSKLLEMSRQAEFFLNLARDAQQLDEVIKPALARGEVCISDRYLYSQLALSAGGRGLPLESLRPAVDLASQGIWPDLVILVDVDPELARLRKRLSKLSGNRVKGDSSRKGLAGAGLSVRVRDFFLELAREDPSRWIVIENNDQPLWALEQRILDAVLARLEGRELQVRRIAPDAPAHPPATVQTLEQRFFAELEQLDLREPALSVYLLTGVPGLLAHKRRLAAAEQFPQLVARSLAGLHDDASYALREILSSGAPVEVLESLQDDPGPRAMGLRAALFDRAAEAAVSGLAGNASAEAWELRQRAQGDLKLLGAILAGLAGVEEPWAWELRDLGLQERLYADLAKSLSGLRGERADALREQLFRHDRLAALRSVAGLDSPFARRIREQLFEKAPKSVLRSLAGIDADYASEMRERAAPYTKEALDSLDAMDSAGAWSIRERFADLWPSTAISSLEGLATTARGLRLIERLLAKNPGRLTVIRNAYRVLAGASAQPVTEVRATSTALAAGLEQAL